MSRSTVVALCLGALAGTPAGARMGPSCEDVRAPVSAPAKGSPDPAGDVRVYAVQYKVELAHVVSYGSFAHKIDCLVRELVLPTADADGNGKADRPTIVVFNEDIGLATLATGSRGASARELAEIIPKNPATLSGAMAVLGRLGVGYAPAPAYYLAREPDTSPQRLILASGTDAFARGFMRTFSKLARRYRLFVVASNNQPEFRETSDPEAVAALADPDLADRYASGELTTVFEAVDDDRIPESVGEGRAGLDVYNQAFMWSPTRRVTDYSRARFEPLNGRALTPADPRSNIIHAVRKTPLTSIERSILDLSDDRDTSPGNTGPFSIPGVPAAKVGYGISLPAFQWGTPLGEAFSGDPCASPSTWMRCLDARGVNLFLQPEANPGCCWAEYMDAGWDPPAWQALSWLDSAWRAVADPSVENIRYAVTPHLVGNLVDLAFDGQSAIFERCLPRPSGGDTCGGNAPATFVGAGSFVECFPPGEPPLTPRCDDPALAPYAGPKREAIAIAPWVMDEDPALDPVANRELLAARAHAMLAGSGSALENAYLETVLWADLDLDAP